jgi:hypothetical protein
VASAEVQIRSRGQLDARPSQPCGQVTLDVDGVVGEHHERQPGGLERLDETVGAGDGLLLVDQDAAPVHEEAWQRAVGHREPAGISQTVARGGRVTLAEAGWPAQSSASATTTPMAGTSEPP